MDPWNWTVDEVVKNLCYSRGLWKDRPNTSLPNPQHLEELLRDNEVNGATLLQDVTKQTLKDDFGIKKFGERSALVHAVAILQSQSASYRAHKAKLEAKEQSSQDATSSQNLLTTPLLQTSSFPQQATPPRESPLSAPRVRDGEILVTDNTGGRKRRKVQPVVVEPIVKPRLAKFNAKSFLMDGKTLIEHVFYDELENGEILVTDDEDDFEFIKSQRHPPGNAEFLRKRIQHYLQTAPGFLEDGRHVINPYPPRLVGKGKGRSVTLIKSGADGIVSATKRDALILDNTTSDDQNVDSNHDWDFLEKWTRRDAVNDLLPVYGDSGSENAFSLDLMNEIEGEEQERNNQANTSVMNLEAVNEAITKAVEAMEEKWHADKEPKREQTSYRTWRKGQGRRGVIAKALAKYELEHLTTVLSNIRTAICDEVWKKPDQITKQCASMELSIYNKLDQEWKLRLWQRQHAPARPPRVAKPIKTLLRVDTEEDVESLHSESDHQSDHLHDFVEDEEDSRMIDVSDSPYMSAHEDIPEREPSPISSPILAARRVSSRSPSPEMDNMQMDSPLPKLSDVMSPLLSRLGSDSHALPSVGMNEEHLSHGDSPDSQLDHRPLIVDLTGSSPAPSPPILGATQATSYGNNPENSNNSEIASWDWDRLELLPDRKRLIMKLFLEMEDAQRIGLFRLIDPMTILALTYEIELGMKALNKKMTHLPGKPAEDFLIVCNLARLFACWFVGRRFYWTTEFQQHGLDDFSNEEDIKEDMAQFLQFSKDLIAKSDLFEAEILAADDVSPRKKRRKFVPKDQKAQVLQETAHLRQLEESNRAAQNIARLKSSFRVDDVEGVPINIGKGPEDEFIFINGHIASKLKPHQVDGVRFMWRELLDSDEGRQGCLLAHTMGLGKTIQTIALLTTIADAANSDNPDIVKLVPEPLRLSRTLVLCPVALIDNWNKEFELWMPEDNSVGNVVTMQNDERRPMSRELRKEQRTEIIRGWWKRGGVLIMGYEAFRIILTNAPSKTNGKPLLDPKELARMQKYLLKGPTIVVTDEAHKMRNRTTELGILVRQFTTKSRIALTGSPLANQLEDYYNMIDFVADGYLGPIDAFKSHYQEPIEAGFYADSTRADQRKALKKLQALMADIDPKVQRADISVMKGMLKNKMEFVITVPLTDVQKRLYVAYVQALNGEELKDVAHANILDWLAFLHLLCCHPSLFITKLLERDVKRGEKARGAMNKLAESEEEAGISTPLADGDSTLTTASISKLAIDRQVEIFSNATIGGDKEAFALSNKAAIIADIVVQSKRVGDRVLLFSHHLAVLSYFEKTFRRLHPGIKTQRLDGGTTAVEKITRTKGFQNNEYDLFLISTRAGGLGLNLPAANRVIMVDFGFNPTWEEQAVGRAYRMGQQKPVYVYHLITGGTFEETMRQRTTFKTQLAIRTVDKKNVVSAAEKSAMYLFEPQDVERSDVTEYEGKDPKVLDFVLKTEAGRNICNLSTTEILHLESKDNLTEEELKEVEQMKEDDKLRRRDPQAWLRRRDEENARENKRRFEEQSRLIQQSRITAAMAAALGSNGISSPASLGSGIPHHMASPRAFSNIATPSAAIGDINGQRIRADANRTVSAWAEKGFGAAAGLLPVRTPARVGSGTPGGISIATSKNDEMAEMMALAQKAGKEPST